jgi:hypothetical protein
MDRLELRTKIAGRIQKFRPSAFDEDLHVRRLSGLQRSRWIDNFQALQKEQESGGLSNFKLTIEAQCSLIACSLVNEAGTRTYQDDELEAVAADLDCLTMDELANEIMVISGMKERQDDRIKNSEPTPNASGSSVLQ